MKPVVGVEVAWFCTVVSVFAVVILSSLGFAYRNGHEEFVGSLDDPAEGEAIAKNIFTAVFVYAGFLVFCGCQGLLHASERRRGGIALQ